MLKKTSGFTLIELLVVIAIIGILAAVVLASLNDARDSGQDASIKQSMGNARSQAELIYNQQTFSYAGVCAAPTIQSLMRAAVNNRAETSDTLVTAVGTPSPANQVTCHSNASGYAIIAPLNVVTTSPAVGAWCVDSTGFAGGVPTITTASLPANDVTCL